MKAYNRAATKSQTRQLVEKGSREEEKIDRQPLLYLNPEIFSHCIFLKKFKNSKLPSREKIRKAFIAMENHPDFYCCLN